MSAALQAQPLAGDVLPDDMLADMARSCGNALEMAFHHGDRDAAEVMQTAMFDLTRLRIARKCAARFHAVDTRSLEGAHHVG